LIRITKGNIASGRTVVVFLSKKPGGALFCVSFLFSSLFAKNNYISRGQLFQNNQFPVFAFHAIA